jgi:hypothetical protein
MCFTADVQGYHWCAALEQEVEQGLSRPKECPIICQLPEGHGDLIDRDELLKESYPDDEYDAHVVYADDIYKARAVVQAEAERSETEQV